MTIWEAPQNSVRHTGNMGHPDGPKIQGSTVPIWVSWVAWRLMFCAFLSYCSQCCTAFYETKLWGDKPWIYEKRKYWIDHRCDNWRNSNKINPLNAELNPICHLLALLRAHRILHVSRIRVNSDHGGCLLWWK